MRLHCVEEAMIKKQIKNRKIFLSVLLLCVLVSSYAVSLLLFSDLSFAEIKVPTLQLDLGESSEPESIMPALKIVGILTIITIAPAIMLMMTSFTRIIIVLGFIRQALGTQTMPPNQIIIGLALFLTFFTMAPVWDEVNNNAIKPFAANAINQDQALEAATKPIRKFMLTETREDDIKLFMNIKKDKRYQTPKDVPMSTLIPSFMVSELKTAFQMGFMVYIPFLIIDMVVSSILMAMGMMMLPPTVVSLPFKLVLFVLVDGWSLIISSVVKSFHSLL